MHYLRLVALLVAIGSAVPVPSGAQTAPMRGLVVDIDYDRRSLALETSAGSRTLSIASDVVIRDHSAQPFAFRDLRPGDAIAYRGRPERVTDVSVSRHFWALPTDD